MSKPVVTKIQWMSVFFLVLLLLSNIVVPTRVFAEEVVSQEDEEVVRTESDIVPIITSVDESQLSVVYKVSDEELKEIENSYNSDLLVPLGTSYGSFKKSSVIGIAAALAGVSGLQGATFFLSVAAILMAETSTDTIYYSYTQTSWRASDGFHVRGTFRFYRNAARTSYITSYTINRVYVND